MQKRVSNHIRHNVYGLVAIVIALTMGTAYATHPGGANTISTEDIQNQAVTNPKIASQTVQTGRLADGAVTNAKIALESITNNRIAPGAVNTGRLANGAVNSAKVQDGSLTADDLNGLEFLRAASAPLNDQPGGGSASQPLFTLGRVNLIAFCQDQGGGTLVGGITPVVDEAGPVLVTDGDGSAADDVVELQPFDVQFVIIRGGNAGLAGRETSFAILDPDGTSASGVAAVSVRPATGDCVITAQATG
jgi:hypothetical protein